MQPRWPSLRWHLALRHRQRLLHEIDQEHALAVLVECDPGANAARARDLATSSPMGEQLQLAESCGITGRPERPRLDASPNVKGKLIGAGEPGGGDFLDIILRD